MPTTAARAKRPSARDDKALRGASHVERERKLWSFLTWSFLLAQIAIAEKLFGSSAQAAIENENAVDGAALGDEQGENAAYVPDVPVFTGSLGPQAKTDAPDAANRFELGKAPADQELPNLDGSASGDASLSIASTGVNSPISAAQASASSQSDGADGDTPSADLDGPDGPQVGIPDLDLTDPTGSLPDVVDGVTDTVLDLLDTTLALDISLDTSIVIDLLDQLGIDLDLPLDLGVDLALDLNPAELVGDVADTTLETVDDVTDLALGTVDDLLAPVTDSPLVASLTDTLNGVPLAGDLVPEDADALFEMAFANAAPSIQPTEEYSTANGQQSDHMIVLSTSEEDQASQADASSSQGSLMVSLQSIPIVGELWSNNTNDDDFGGLVIIDDTTDSTTSLIDDPSPTNGWGMGL
jgi:hypothetical protein